MCPRAFCALCIVISTLNVGAFAAEDCRNTGSTLKEALTDDDLPLSLVQIQAIRTRNTKAHLQNETENSTLEAAVVLLPSHSTQGVPTNFDKTLGSYMTVSSANNFQAFMCTFGLACFAFIFILNAFLLCVQTQHQGSKKISPSFEDAEISGPLNRYFKARFSSTRDDQAESPDLHPGAARH